MDEGISLGLVMALVEEATGADPAVIEQAVQDWLDAHPEATTTVADGSITEQKLAAAVAAKINQVSQLSDEIAGVQLAGKMWKIGTGLPIESDGTISIMNSSSFTLYGAVANPNTNYVIYRVGTTFSTYNRVFVLFLNKIIQTKSEFVSSAVIGHSAIETSGTARLKTDTLQSPQGTKMIMICQPSANTIPYSGRIEPTVIVPGESGCVTIPASHAEITMDDLAKNPNAQKDGDTLVFDATSSAINTNLPFIFKAGNMLDNIVIAIENATEGVSGDGVEAPNVIYRFNKLFESVPYCFYNPTFAENRHRMPAFGEFEYIRPQLIVPAGMKLKIKSIHVYNSDYKRNYQTGARLTAHLGMITLAPENSEIGFKIAAKTGYPSAICNPKVTSDEVLVCYHDTNINTTARNTDGTQIDHTVSIAGNTYETLNQYDYGIYKDAMYAGTKLLLLEDFFRLCAINNVQPVFSIHHTNPLDNTAWGTIKGYLLKYGFDKSLMVKSGSILDLETAYQNIGNNAFGYVLDLGGVTVEQGIAVFNDSAVFSTTARKYIGISRQNVTDAKIAQIVNAGYYCELYDLQTMPTYLYKHYMACGVSEFVDDCNSSFGYLW